MGDKPGVAENDKNDLIAKYPDLKILGTHHGYFKKIGKENNLIIDQINRLIPDILVVGFGMSIREEWINENYYKLSTKVIMTGGNCFSFIAGQDKRAPSWMHKNSLEWLYRFQREPKRMFSRYIIEILHSL